MPIRATELHVAELAAKLKVSPTSSHMATYTALLDQVRTMFAEATVVPTTPGAPAPTLLSATPGQPVTGVGSLK